MKYLCHFFIISIFYCFSSCKEENIEPNNKPFIELTYPIVESGIKQYYNNLSIVIGMSEDSAFYGQDAHYNYNKISYTDNSDLSISDNVTGLMWAQDMGEKISFDQAVLKAKESNLAGYSDWRIPSIKELYSLILFTGKVKGSVAISMFIDTKYFRQKLGDLILGEREIDAQTWSSTQYVGKTMHADESIFGLNFVDGRIKAYPKYNHATKQVNKMYFRLVRGNTKYGINDFVDNKDGSISDIATGLMWQKSDDGISRDWEEALKYCQYMKLASHTDWRLPNAKELQSIVDYSRSPQTSKSPAINPVFECSTIKYIDNTPDRYPYYWSSTTHHDGINPYSSAVYIAFGEGLGLINGSLLDVHGAGCQRSDPKSGNPDAYPQYVGPQGDLRCVYNYVRAVRTIK